LPEKKEKKKTAKQKKQHLGGKRERKDWGMQKDQFPLCPKETGTIFGKRVARDKKFSEFREAPSGFGSFHLTGTEISPCSSRRPRITREGETKKKKVH